MLAETQLKMDRVAWFQAIGRHGADSRMPGHLCAEAYRSSRRSLRHRQRDLEVLDEIKASSSNSAAMNSWA
ncbi:hypothetical protein AU467_27720 [Mesorhizobium loti]|uniref:Uncharacterized protein n=1 Tax=Rhizobium loti TaxID=381 RepID=A0A101KQJ9_RHILI|nr:hypothetical protein AU467_27720 [Mesorhizobium loti]